jgi:hypothetical protein
LISVPGFAVRLLINTRPFFDTSLAMVRLLNMRDTFKNLSSLIIAPY